MLREPDPRSLDLSKYDAIQIARELDGMASASTVSVVLPDGNSALDLDGFAAGVKANVSVQIRSSVGDFAFLGVENAGFDVHGDGGDWCGHSLGSGEILIHGSVGHAVGAYARGGFIAVHGKAAINCGFRLNGGEIVVRGEVGDEAGREMVDGVIVLGHGAGHGLGKGMRGGMIFLRGEAKSLAPELRKVRLKDADSLRLSLLLARAGIKAASGDFSGYRPREQGKRQ